MADLNKVRLQVLDPKTGAVIDSVDVKTSDGAVYLPDGTTLRNYIVNNDEIVANLQELITEHLAIKHVDASKVDSVITGIEYESATGTFKVTNHKGEESTIDTLLEKIAVNFDLVDVTDPETGKVSKKLEITLDDNTKKYADLSALVDVYTGDEEGGVKVTVTNGKISAEIKDASISYDKLDADLKSKVDAQFELSEATTETLGGVIIGDGIAVTEDGTISANNVKVDGVAKSLEFKTVASTTPISVSGPASTVERTQVGTPVQAQTIEATGEGLTLTYQWYKKVIGTDVAFSPIEGATTNTLAADKIAVNAEGTTMYYCCVSAEGADPVASKQITVIVAA